MSVFQIITTFFEFAAVVLLIVGFINEKKIVAFERKFFRAVKIHVRNYLRRKLAEEQKTYVNAQSRAPVVYEDEVEEKPVLTVIEGKSSHRVA